MAAEEKGRSAAPGGTNLHAGHRARMKEQFLTHGLEGFTDVQALELLLFYALPQKDTNELAHLLLNEFGSLRRVLEARAEELARVKGLKENSALLITLVAAMNRRYIRHVRMERKEHRRLDSATEWCNYIQDLFRYTIEEEIWILCLSGDWRLLSERRLASGAPSSVVLSVRTVVEAALRENAYAVILTHNHIADLALPSQADCTSTEKLYHALKLVDVLLLDHVIVADNDCVSLRDSGFFKQFEG